MKMLCIIIEKCLFYESYLVSFSTQFANLAFENYFLMKENAYNKKTIIM